MIKITNKFLKNKFAFTLIEIMVWIIIVSLIILWWFQALSAITIWKARIIEKVDIQKEGFYFTEKLFEMIKKWWTLDYEEYFNRMVIWNTTYSSGHFEYPSWFGNFWSWGTVWTSTYWDIFYYCISWDWYSNKIIDSWCYNNSLNTYWESVDWKHQRYWQYSFQFIDYNSNYNIDIWSLWDENGDGNIKWDDDDEYIWNWPAVFWTGIELPELYLISWNKKERLMFRWSLQLDDKAPVWSTCIVDSNNNVTGSGCIWTVEYIKLIWKDYWFDHNISILDKSQNDWIVDTWIIDPEISWWVEEIAWKNNTPWVELFSNSISVSEFKTISYPNKDIIYSWKDTNKSVNISPYTVLKLSLEPSWLYKRKMIWNRDKMNFSMTINLTDLYSQ